MNPTFNLPNKSAYSGGVVGNGKALGITDGTNLGGLATGSQDTGLYATTGSYNLNVGTTRPTGDMARSKVAGITTDPTKSGMIVETDADLVVCIKY